MEKRKIFLRIISGRAASNCTFLLVIYISTHEWTHINSEARTFTVLLSPETNFPGWRSSGGSRLLVPHNKTAKLYGRVTHIEFSTSSDLCARVWSSAYRWRSLWSPGAPPGVALGPSGRSLSAPLLQTATHPHGHHLRVAVVVLHDEGMILKSQTNRKIINIS